MQQLTIDPTKPHATKADVAAHFNVTTRTVENWLAENPPIPHYRRAHSIRFKLAELEEHLKQKAEHRK